MDKEVSISNIPEKVQKKWKRNILIFILGLILFIIISIWWFK